MEYTRREFVKLGLASLGLVLFEACKPKIPIVTPTRTPEATTPIPIPTPEIKPRKQIQIYRKIDRDNWLKSHAGLPYIEELSTDRLILYDVVGGYTNDDLVEQYLLITKDFSPSASVPYFVVLDEEEKIRGYQKESFERNFSDLSVIPKADKLIVNYGYGNKRGIKVFTVNERSQLAPKFWYEADRIQILENGEILGTSIFNQNGTRRLVTEYFVPTSTGIYSKTEAPAEIKAATTMDFLLSRPTKNEIELLKTDVGDTAFDTAVDYLMKVDGKKTEIEPTIISDPSQAIKQLEDILKTDDPFIVGEAFKKVSEDLYVADSQTGEAKPLWKYIVEYRVKEGGVEVRGNVDAFLVYYGLKYGLELTPVGGIGLPWAEGEPLAIVVAREVTKDIAEKPGSTYITLRLREENGELKVEGDVEVGSRAIQLHKEFNAFVVVTKDGYEKYEPYLTEGRWGGGVQTILRDTADSSRMREQEERKKTEETINQLKEKLEEIKETPEYQKVGQQIENAMRDLEEKAYDVLDWLKKKIEE